MKSSRGPWHNKPRLVHSQPVAAAAIRLTANATVHGCVKNYARFNLKNRAGHHLADVALRAGLHQRHLRGLAEPVHVAPRLDVVQAVQHQVEAAEEIDAEPRLLNVRL